MFYLLLEKQKKMFNKEKSFFLKDKRSQIGETMTWVVATIIIIVILLISIFIATSYLGGSKKADFSKQSDILASKSFFAYLLTEDAEGKTIYEQLRDEENLNDFNGNLAIRIFNGFYAEDYPHTIWLGIDFEGFGLPRKNEYFGFRPTTLRGGDISYRTVDYILEKAILNNDKWLELILMNK